MIIDIEAKNLKTVSLAISKEKYRFYLNGVHVRAKDGLAIVEATDGHRLMRVQFADENKADINVILSIDSVKLILDLCKAQKIASFTLDAETKNVVIGETAYPVSFVDGTYPDTDRIIPDNDQAETKNKFSFNFAYLADFSKALNFYGVKSIGVIKLGKNPASDIMKINATDDSSLFTGLLMPVRMP